MSTGDETPVESAPAAGDAPSLPVALRAGAATSAGRVRSQNQDRYLVVDNSLFIVADGMGGHVGGEVAAQLTVDTLSSLAASGRPLLRTNDVIDRVEAANVSILTRADREPELRGMGTTITGLAVVEGDNTAPALLLVVNVGDSRTYWLRNGELEQLSDDHSVVGELIREGKLTSSEARTHKNRSVLTRALGVEPNVECDVLEIVPIVGDRFLVCSDGLPTELADATIAATLRQFRDPAEAAATLVRDAVDHGGRDNVTVIVVDVVAGIDGSGVGAASGHASANDAKPTAVKAAKAAKPPKPPKDSGPKAPRRPWIINLRVLLFLAALGAIAAVVVWTVRNAPSADTTPDTVVSTATTTTLVGATDTGLTLDSTPAPTNDATNANGAASATTTASLTPDAGLPATSTTLDLADPVQAAVVDPFASTTTSPAPTTTKKK